MLTFVNWKDFSQFGKIFLTCFLILNCSPKTSQTDFMGQVPFPGLGPNLTLPEDGEYFSEIRPLENGYFVRQIFLFAKRRRPEFLISQLVVTSTKNWEETRFEGKLIEDPEGKGYRFVPRLCRIYTTKEAGGRWALARAFECDHLEFLIWNAGPNQVRLFPGPEGEEDGLLLQRSPSSSPNRIAAIIVRAESGFLDIWGMRLSRVRKNATLVLEKADGRKTLLKSLKTVETTGEILGGGLPLKVGDLILYTNPGEANPLVYE
ncbi:hypothetical protein CH373_06710 [Leptospira perolatii]|uniref:Uncharacterized protein n=1 Tax=Leptospira perolatii TaxID=2023191 RepID=A0A2M9ZPB6_9LEPT|nr:hypothetical protein [Leptospira perolatii]PJZ70630.1 hypothetical protein CH360_03570 [Leptospira perolatii]PJZ73841.1 hypothetical protein CH373_06710 [Leptospira perolatii]